MKTYYVYIIRCANDSFYVGITNDIERRIMEHNLGEDKSAYTYSRRPVKLVWSEYYNDVNQAIEKEKQLKGWSRKKKQALVDGDFDLLVHLSKSKKNPSTSSG